MPKRPASRPRFSPSRQLLPTLLCAAEAARESAFGAMESELGLSPGKFRLLTTLADSAGPLSAGTLAQTLKVSDATVSIMVKRMLREDEPLVRRTPSGLDHRAVEIELTERGAALLSLAQALVEAGSWTFASPLSKAEQLLLIGLLEKLEGGRN